MLAYYKSPIGIIEITTTETHIIKISLVDTVPESQNSSELILQCKNQLEEYFSGVRTKFDLPLKQSGTNFQQEVWQALAKISYSETMTYSEIAKIINKPTSYRAVGSACGKNNLPIIIPCHRVISKNGLGGFSFGSIDNKKWLLNHEKIKGI